jgi:hypothetical protein
MPKFRVEYIGAREGEEVEASTYFEEKGWIVFVDVEGEYPVSSRVERLRLKGASIQRIERILD